MQRPSSAICDSCLAQDSTGNTSFRTRPSEPTQTSASADFFVLNAEGRYQQVPINHGIHRSNVLPGFWLKVDWMWKDDPDVLAALASIIGTDTLAQALKK